MPVNGKRNIIAIPQKTILQNRNVVPMINITSCGAKRAGKAYVTGKEKFTNIKSFTKSSKCPWKDEDVALSFNSNKVAHWGSALFPFKYAGGGGRGISNFYTNPSE